MSKHEQKILRERIWEISAFISPLLIGIALGVSGLISLKLANVLLCVSAIGVFVMVITCSWFSGLPSRKKKIGASVFIGLGIITGLCVGIHFLGIGVAAYEAKHLQPEYPRVRFVVGQDKKIRIKNDGTRDLKNVRIFVTEYVLDEEGLKVGAVRISSAGKSLSPIRTFVTVGPGQNSPEVDLGMYVRLSPFSSEIPTKDEARFLALRIVFTGGVPEKDYVSYRITSGIRFNPYLPDNPEEVAFGGGYKDSALQLEAQIVDNLKLSQRLIFGTELEEYKF